MRRGDLLWWISYIGQVLVRGLNDVGWSGVTAPSSIKQCVCGQVHCCTSVLLGSLTMLTREGKGDETKGDGEDGEIYKCGSCGRVEAWEKVVLAIRRRDRNSGHGSYGI